MPTLVAIDGQHVQPESACISVFDRGFLYGDSVFEVLRTYGGRPFALASHLERLARSAGRVFIELPVTLDELAREIEGAIRASGNGEAYVRIMLTRGVGDTLGLDPGLAHRPTRVIFVSELVSPPAIAYEQGIAVISYRGQRVTDASEAAGAKVGNYLLAVLANRAARQAGALEALIVDAHGRIVEGATSNVFAVLGGRLITPPESDGILAGITRQHLLRVAAELSIPASEQSLELAQAERADELFISSSIRELLPVVALDGQPIGAGVPGPLTRRLLEAFRDSCWKSVGIRRP
jgi:branched-chain amino acid aminotransferase